MNSFTTELTVDRTPEEVFAAVTDVRSWFSKTITGAASPGMSRTRTSPSSTSTTNGPTRG
ncbi:hypothetical protein [Amycolatopsis rubida]|uniref:Polyketide cyclase / dehydrase and lipid transport n=1 Tax=Amycolatopsis rubida TaxID=112413 RepID=A0A1I5GAY3_9PSEU|nr:hypothetical protein A4R44_01137 [Amycolatopsis sp. M39]SFO33087.1 hypothetical protein SAMN05421854_1011524 [Amycolatopsis rubida]